MKFFFIVDYKKNSGIGHLKRSLLLAQRLQNLNHKIYFLCNKTFLKDKKTINFIKISDKNLSNNIPFIRKK